MNDLETGKSKRAVAILTEFKLARYIHLIVQNFVLMDCHGGRTRAGVAHCSNTCP
jgi:hypothetical protein